MKFSTLAALSSLALATAQNAFTMPTLPAIIHAGTPFNLTWQATTPGDVSIWLVQGPSSDTKYIATIAGNITNSGQFTWTPSSSLQSGSSYALEIVSDSDTFITNYSGQFSLDGGSSSVDTSNSSSSGISTTGASSSATTTGASSTSSGGSKTTMATVTGESTGSATSTGSSVPDSNKSAAGVVEAAMSVVGLVVAAVAVFVL